MLEFGTCQCCKHRTFPSLLLRRWRSDPRSFRSCDVLNVASGVRCNQSLCECLRCVVLFGCCFCAIPRSLIIERSLIMRDRIEAKFEFAILAPKRPSRAQTTSTQQAIDNQPSFHHKQTHKQSQSQRLSALDTQEADELSPCT